ncbi:cell wall metabolism sensor histidine kinase WalK [Pedobacter sp. L105]|uniref:sensor histidine kinase n=1 Tax=Pedobacter sp. L105 TaxID=1641871 RepID=UPI00131EA55E|nr:HAMP domain-containing sensor histidine kinase [Pedobacter sp. L105]
MINRDTDFLEALQIDGMGDNISYLELIKRLPVAVYTLDEKARITFFNPAAVTLWGRTPVLGEEFWCGSYRMYNLEGKWVPHDECPAAIAMKESRFLKAEAMVQRPDGEMRQILAYPQPMKSADGTVKGLINAVVDITERKALERQKDEFMAVVSHELKSPLTSVKGYAQILKKKLAVTGDDSMLAMAEKMESQINRLTYLIDTFLDSAKTGSGQLEHTNKEFDLGVLISEVVENVQMTTDTHQLKQIKVVSVNLIADKERTSQVLINFLTNAIKYSPDASQVLINTYTEEGKVVCCVEDFGLGIQKSQVGRVFEKFYRVSNEKSFNFSGVGLGLYISAEIIKQMGGEIWVESELDKGSKFYFSLPCVMANDTGNTN